MPNDPDVAALGRFATEYIDGPKRNEPVSRFEFGQLLRTLHRVLTKTAETRIDGSTTSKIRRDTKHVQARKPPSPTKTRKQK